MWFPYILKFTFLNTIYCKLFPVILKTFPVLPSMLYSLKSLLKLLYHILFFRVHVYFLIRLIVSLECLILLHIHVTQQNIHLTCSKFLTNMCRRKKVVEHLVYIMCSCVLKRAIQKQRDRQIEDGKCRKTSYRYFLKYLIC